jgi:ATP-dependent DNA helicase RecQ
VQTVRTWIEQLVSQAYFEKTDTYNILRLTPRGLALNRGEETPILTDRASVPAGRATLRKSAAARVGVELGPLDSTLFEILRRLRREKAEELGVPPFVVFSDATLRDMARRKPLTPAAFLEVQGVGRKKSDAFGGEFIAAIKIHCEEESRP